jgi:hypothetical protein
MPEWLEIAIVRFHYEAAWWQWQTCPWDEQYLFERVARRFRDRLEFHFCVSIEHGAISGLSESNRSNGQITKALNAAWRFLQGQARAYGYDAEYALDWVGWPDG